MALVSADAKGEWAESVLAGEPLAASLAHADLGRLRVEYFPYDPFAERIWELRGPGLAAPPGSPERVRPFFPPGPASSGTGATPRHL